MHYDRPNPPPADLVQLAARFRVFAGTEAEESSPLYHRLALAVADDPEMLALAAHARSGQPPANLLLGAVHFLLLRSPAHVLADYYADLTPAPRPPAEAATPFRDFCLERRAALVEMLRTRLVQTNELRRCAYLLPAFSWIAAQTRRPLALIEVGASAGLNLLFDRYAYRYALGDAAVCAGEPGSPVEIDAGCCVVSGATLSLGAPSIACRTGIDLNPVDLAEEDAYTWLRALIWPEHHDRVRRLAAARTLWRAQPPVLVRGDAVDVLPALLDAVAEEATPVVFHTHVLNQFTPAAADALEAIFRRHAATRQIHRLGNDLGGGTAKQYVLRARVYQGEAMQETVLGYADGHARRIEWLAGM